MSQSPLGEAFETGRAALGAWVSLPAAPAAEIVARAGFDYVCIDMQHGMVDYSDTLHMLASIDLGTSTPVVRVPWNEPGIIGKVLDAGALGVIIPMVNTPEQAEAAVQACHYPPRGERSFGPNRALQRHGSEYFPNSERLVQCIPMIETHQGVFNLDRILSVTGIDAVYVGPSDMSVSLGLAPGNNDGVAAFDDALAAVLAGCARHGVVPGVHTTSELAPRRLEQGFRMLTVSSDTNVLAKGMADDLRVSREAAAISAKQGA